MSHKILILYIECIVYTYLHYLLYPVLPTSANETNFYSLAEGLAC